MQLLVRRSQSRSQLSGRTHYHIWAKSEFTADEKDMLLKYGMSSAVLIRIAQPNLMKYCILLGTVVFALSIPLLAFNFYRAIGLGWVGVVCVAFLIAVAASFIAYHQWRETIFVKDLVHGRYFKCRSVIELARKEAYLQMVASYFRQVLESAKHWGGTETIEIEALPPEEAKRSILSGPLLE